MNWGTYIVDGKGADQTKRDQDGFYTSMLSHTSHNTKVDSQPQSHRDCLFFWPAPLSPSQPTTEPSKTTMSSRAGTPTGGPSQYPRSPVAALSSQNTPSSSRAQSLHSSVSHQSSFSAADAARHLSQEHVAKTSQEMFRKISDYVKSEMLGKALFSLLLFLKASG